MKNQMERLLWNNKEFNNNNNYYTEIYGDLSSHS